MEEKINIEQVFSDLKILRDKYCIHFPGYQKSLNYAIDRIKGYRELEKTQKIIEHNYQVAMAETINKNVIKEKIEELKKEYEIALEENSTKAFILKCQIDILEKLMEDK